jgi:hypothetical protein
MIALLLGLIPGLTNGLAAWLTAQGNEKLAQIGADKDVALAHLNSITAANNAKASIVALPWAKWLMFLLYVPPLLHAAGIELGRMHLINFDMMSMDQNEVYILLSLVIYVPAARAVG